MKLIRFIKNNFLLRDESCSDDAITSKTALATGAVAQNRTKVRISEPTYSINTSFSQKSSRQISKKRVQFNINKLNDVSISIVPSSRNNRSSMNFVKNQTVSIASHSKRKSSASIIIKRIGRNTPENILIDNDDIYFPPFPQMLPFTPIANPTPTASRPKTPTTSLQTSKSVAYINVNFATDNCSPLTVVSAESQAAAKKVQPSMGVKAQTLRSRRNNLQQLGCFDSLESKCHSPTMSEFGRDDRNAQLQVMLNEYWDQAASNIVAASSTLATANTELKSRLTPFLDMNAPAIARSASTTVIQINPFANNELFPAESRNELFAPIKHIRPKC